MGGSRREGDDGPGEGRPVEPAEAREHGNDPDAVTIHRRGGVNGEQGERQTATDRRDDGEREPGGSEEAQTQQADGEVAGSSMEKSDKILIATLAIVGVVALAVILVLSLLRTPEWMQFVLALVLFAALGLGAYRYVITPSGRRQESRSD